MSFLSATLLIPACAIGAGLLSFPVITGLSGFIPSTIAILFSWLFTSFTGMMIMELTFALKGESKKHIHFFSINEKFLPKSLQYISIFLFLFMCYLSLVAYTDAIAPTFNAFFDFKLDYKTFGVIGLFCLYILMFLDKKILFTINNILTPILFISYGALLFFGFKNYDSTILLAHTDFKFIHSSVPIIVAAFSYAFVIPSMINVMNSTKKTAFISLWIGTTINCIIYLIWNLTMLGCIPLPLLLQAYKDSAPVTSVLKGNALSISGNIFALFALLTSFISISISIIEYWQDHLKQMNKIILNSLVFLPVIILFISFDKLFLRVFSMTGGYGDSILFGILPVYMIKKASLTHNVKLSKIITIFSLFCGITIIGIQLILDFTSFF